jgi:hypothetical protein
VTIENSKRDRSAMQCLGAVLVLEQFDQRERYIEQKSGTDKKRQVCKRISAKAVTHIKLHVLTEMITCAAPGEFPTNPNLTGVLINDQGIIAALIWRPQSLYSRYAGRRGSKVSSWHEADVPRRLLFNRYEG